MELAFGCMVCSLPLSRGKQTKRKTKKVIFLRFSILKTHPYKDWEQKSTEQLHSSA